MDKFDVIIVGGSYAGLSAAMGLGRALRKVLIVDSRLPSNRFTPFSHNFITHDGTSPAEINRLALHQVLQYPTVHLINGLVTDASREGDDFVITLSPGEKYVGLRLVFATGIVDELPGIEGLSHCWGKSVLHCPYCHGYEVRNVATGILGTGDYAFEFASLISNWTSDLSIYTNGPSSLTKGQTAKLLAHNIPVIEEKIKKFHHQNGYLEAIEFDNAKAVEVKVMYLRAAFHQHSDLPKKLGCELTSDGHIAVDPGYQTTIPGVYACGDNVTRMRTVANAVAMGTSTAIALNKDLVLERFL